MSEGSAAPVSYEDDVRIDEMALDVEWLRQPELMAKYARLAAEARRAYDLEKERRDVVRAQVRARLLSNPEAYGLSKTTEAAVEAAIVLDPEYQAASRAVIEAKYSVDMMAAAVQAMEGRKAALENLVRLYAASYFAGPSVPRDLSAALRDRDERRGREVNRKVKISRKGEP